MEVYINFGVLLSLVATQGSVNIQHFDSPSVLNLLLITASTK